MVQPKGVSIEPTLCGHPLSTILSWVNGRIKTLFSQSLGSLSSPVLLRLWFHKLKSLEWGDKRQGQVLEMFGEQVLGELTAMILFHYFY